MVLLLFADQWAAFGNWWFDFAHVWADSASVLGLLLTVVGFVLTFLGFFRTWSNQAEIKREVTRALKDAARVILLDALSQLLQRTLRARQSAETQAWQSAHDLCDEARRLTLGMRTNPHLTAQERALLIAHADDLMQIRDYIRRNKLVPNPPAVFNADKRAALDALETFVISVQARLQALAWEA